MVIGTLTTWAATAATAQARRIHDVTWETVGAVPPQDTLLLNPTGLTADDRAVYVFDAGDYQIKAFSWSGQRLWTHGRIGSGPGEFRSVLTLALGSDGALWAYDHGNARITILASDGQVRRQFSMPHPMLPGGLAPLTGGRFLAQTFVKSPFLVLYDSLGSEIRRLPTPAEFRGRDMIQARLRSGVSAHPWVVWSSVYTDRLYFVNMQRDTVMALRGVQPMEFPKTQAATIRTPDGKTVGGVRPDPSNVTGGIAIAQSGERVFVLVGNAASPSFRTLDVYALASGRYLESLLLPEVCHAFTMVREACVCVQLDPAPQIKIFRVKHGMVGQ